MYRMAEFSLISSLQKNEIHQDVYLTAITILVEANETYQPFNSIHR